MPTPRAKQRYTVPFMMRHAEDDFEALKTADAMERSGATVIAITPRALAPHVQYIVWARVRDDIHIRAIDVEIWKEIRR